MGIIGIYGSIDVMCIHLCLSFSAETIVITSLFLSFLVFLSFHYEGKGVLDDKFKGLRGELNPSKHPFFSCFWVKNTPFCCFIASFLAF